MIEVEVRYLARQIFRLQQAGIGIFGRVARDRAGLFHGGADGLAPQVRGAGRAFALAEIDRHRKAAVALILDRVDLAQPHGRTEPLAQTDIDLVLRGALAPGFLEREAGNVLEQWGVRLAPVAYAFRSNPIMGQNFILAAAKTYP